MRFEGTISSEHEIKRPARVVLVGENNSIAGETQTDANGRWSLDVTAPVLWIVAQISSGSILVASAATPDSESIIMPEYGQLEFEFQNAPEGVMIWLDPVALEGFPDELMWVLRTHPNNIVDLHVGQFPVDAPSLKLDLQPGKYRLSGGRFEISPTTSQGSITLKQAVNDKGEIIETVDGVIVFDLQQSNSYRLIFAPTE